MAQIEYTLEQLMNLIKEGVAKDASFISCSSDRIDFLGDDTTWKIIGYSTSESSDVRTGILCKAMPSNTLFVVTGESIQNWIGRIKVIY